jgi:hypothetical protein
LEETEKLKGSDSVESDDPTMAEEFQQQQSPYSTHPQRVNLVVASLKDDETAKKRPNDSVHGAGANKKVKD